MPNGRRSFAGLAIYVIASLLSTGAFAEGFDAELRSIQLAIADSRKPDKSKEQRIVALDALAPQARAFVAAHPERAEPLKWEGVVLSDTSVARANMSSLGLIKQARKNFETMAKLDERVFDWAAHCLLANWYWHVPGWPVGFGDKKRADQLFKRAIELNPTGAEPHYFYAQFLLDQKRYDEAMRQYEAALNAPLRVGETQDPATGFACNAMRCMHQSPETDARFRKAVEGGIAKAREGMKHE